MEFNISDFQQFSRLLLLWGAIHKRDLPWKHTQDPYLIWLSEIILQQTRVAQGLPYFIKFAETFPTVQHLADAPQDVVMRCWEGLGYYSRARNMHSAAQYIVRELNGIFPTDYKQIRQLKGVGDYTAAAIASFAFGLPYPVLDGNVYRVLARYFGIATPIDSTAGKREFAFLAEQVLDKSCPAEFNQAIMDFGAVQCVPQQPVCSICALAASCRAFSTQNVAFLPVKNKRVVRKTRYFNYLVIQIPAGSKGNYDDNRQAAFSTAILLCKRSDRDIWQGLYEFPVLESEQDLLGRADIETWLSAQDFGQDSTVSIKSISPIHRQLLTHQEIIARFFIISMKKIPAILPLNAIVVPREDILHYACPKIVNDFWRDMLQREIKSGK